MKDNDEPDKPAPEQDEAPQQQAEEVENGYVAADEESRSDDVQTKGDVENPQEFLLKPTVNDKKESSKPIVHDGAKDDLLVAQPPNARNESGTISEATTQAVYEGAVRPGAVSVSGIGFNSQRFTTRENDDESANPSTVMVDAFIAPEEPDVEQIRARIIASHRERLEKEEKEKPLVEGIKETISAGSERQKHAKFAACIGLLFVACIAAIITGFLVNRGDSENQTTPPSFAKRELPTPAPSTNPPTLAPTVDRFEALLALLGDKIATSTSAFRDNSTSQYKALDWLANEDPANLPIEESLKRTLMERYVIMVLTSQDDTEVVLQSAGLNFGSALSVCDWNNEVNLGRGIKCNNETWISHIVLNEVSLRGKIPSEIGLLNDLEEIKLSLNMLSGTIPLFLVQMPGLRKVDLGFNEFIGTIPIEFGQLANAQDVSIGGNVLEGSIPTELGRLSALTSLVLHLNLLTGNIPTELARLSRLKHLLLESNALTSTIPTGLLRLTNLEELWLGENTLTGAIPSECGLLTALTSFWLDETFLTGTIPTEVGNMLAMQELWIFNNVFLGGTLPTELGRLSDLQSLWLQGNELTGTIPVEFENLTALDMLFLYYNFLIGIIPTGLGKLTKLFRLELYDNLLTGPLPTELGRFRRIEWLSLDTNFLTGTMPTELGNLIGARGTVFGIVLSKNRLNGTIPTELGLLTDVAHLDLGFDNDLTGSIPTELGNLTALSFLSLHDNQLTGRIPTELGRLDELKYLYFGQNQLTGTIPTEMGLLTRVESFNVYTNALTGQIPAEFGQLNSTLNWLSLFANQLSGTIPTQFGNMAAVVVLSLRSNQLNGTIPTELARLTELQGLFLQDNSLSGTVWSGFGNGSLAQLTNLKLHNNNLSGSLDPMFCDAPRELPWAGLTADCGFEIECSCCTICCPNSKC